MPLLIRAETRWPVPGKAVLTARRKFMLQEVVYSGGEAAENATGCGGVAGGYQPGKVGNLHERFARL